MHITNPGTAQAGQALAAATATATSATAPQASFGADLQSLLAGQSTSPSDTAQTASLTDPGPGTPSTAQHHHRGPDDGVRTANGMTNGSAAAAPGSSAGSPSGLSTGTASTAAQQTAGGLLFNDMMRGLQAYGATASTT